MTHCAKCGTELIGSKKFCTACGTPTTSPRATTGAVPSSDAGPAGSAGGEDKAKIASHIDPLASTVMPRPDRPEYGPPPAPARVGSRPPPPASSLPAAPVSPLAVSNVISQRNAFAEASAPVVSVKPASIPPPADALASTVPAVDSMKARGIPATAAMPSVPGVPSGAPAGAPSPEPRTKDRTQLMGAFGRPPSVRPPAALGSMGPQPQAPGRAGVVPPPTTPNPYGSGAVPTPHGPGAVAHQGQPAPAYPAAAGHGHGAPWGFAPGARVQVSWSDGRKYPGTVQQVSGSQHLVVFPDGQHHWVDLPYLSPG